ncbi:WD40-repeat-containing domain protein [Schizothecium vesticola]|uniref:WD40-repeat-containing domain protein n=1 Tax=Schizothecium vesticola TaxID=314040 RepID=A0AA40KBI5_9PEZI|nr:WD40-repeat-containing domain protein [Schizothecium vesticola]
MAKRKRDTALPIEKPAPAKPALRQEKVPQKPSATTPVPPSKKPATKQARAKSKKELAQAAAAPLKLASDETLTVQIVTGSYDRTQKVLLATGSADERINIYSLSAHPPSSRAAADQAVLSAATPRPVLENAKNREVGTLLHHSGNVTRLHFPNRAKLMTAGEDSAVAVARTRDWNVLHTFKCPVPLPRGRPSGDTAALGTGPSGVNDFAVHPSHKLMFSVSKGENCMRLWNLMTGKKAGKCEFKRAELVAAGETKHSTGGALRIVWGGEDEFAVGFERNGLVYGGDCVVRCKLLEGTGTKVHGLAYVQVGEAAGERVVAVSTEDGRVLFCSAAEGHVKPAAEVEEKEDGRKGKKALPGLPCATLVAQLGGKEAGVQGRIKDFVVVPVEDEEGARAWYVVTAGSDGRVRVWRLGADDLRVAAGNEGRQVGRLLGTYETQNRITCVGGFAMIPKPEGAEESEFEFESSDEDEEDSDEE